MDLHCRDLRLDRFVLFHSTPWALHSDLTHIDIYGLYSDSTEMYFYWSTFNYSICTEMY